MSKMDTEGLVDIFKEEITKKKKKELKMKAKQEKKMEKQENIAFEKLTKAETKKQEEDKKAKRHYEKETKDLKDSLSLFGFFYDTIFGFFLVLLLLCSFGYCAFLLNKTQTKETILLCSLLMSSIIFYILSLTCKGQKIKKFMAIGTSLSACLLILYLIYIA